MASSSGGNAPPFIYWLTAWVITIVGLVLLSKTRWGQTVEYGLLWLMILYVLLTHGGDIANIFQQGNITAGNEPSNGGITQTPGNQYG